MEWIKIEVRGDENTVRSFIASISKDTFLCGLTMRSLPNSADVVCRVEGTPDTEADFVSRREFMEWANENFGESPEVKRTKKADSTFETFSEDIDRQMSSVYAMLEAYQKHIIDRS